MDLKVNLNSLEDASQELKNIDSRLSDIRNRYCTLAYEILNEMEVASEEDIKSAVEKILNMLDEGSMTLKKHERYLINSYQEYLDTERSICALGRDIKDSDMFSGNSSYTKPVIPMKNFINPTVIINPIIIPFIIIDLPDADIGGISDKKGNVIVPDITDDIISGKDQHFDYTRLFMNIISYIAPGAVITGMAVISSVVSYIIVTGYSGGMGLGGLGAIGGLSAGFGNSTIGGLGDGMGSGTGSVGAIGTGGVDAIGIGSGYSPSGVVVSLMDIGGGLLNLIGNAFQTNYNLINALLFKYILDLLLGQFTLPVGDGNYHTLADFLNGNNSNGGEEGLEEDESKQEEEAEEENGEDSESEPDDLSEEENVSAQEEPSSSDKDEEAGETAEDEAYENDEPLSDEATEYVEEDNNIDDEVTENSYDYDSAETGSAEDGSAIDTNYNGGGADSFSADNSGTSSSGSGAGSSGAGAVSAASNIGSGRALADEYVREAASEIDTDSVKDVYSDGGALSYTNGAAESMERDIASKAKPKFENHNSIYGMSLSGGASDVKPKANISASKVAGFAMLSAGVSGGGAAVLTGAAMSATGAAGAAGVEGAKVAAATGLAGGLAILGGAINVLDMVGKAEMCKLYWLSEIKTTIL